MDRKGRQREAGTKATNNNGCLIATMPERAFALLGSTFHGVWNMSPKKIVEKLNSIDRRGRTFAGSRWFGDKVELHVHGVGKQAYNKDEFFGRIDARNIKPAKAFSAAA